MRNVSRAQKKFQEIWEESNASQSAEWEEIISEYLWCEEACGHLDSQELKNCAINNYFEQDHYWVIRL